MADYSLDTWLNDINAANDLDVLDGLRLSIIGKKGTLAVAMKGLGKLDPDARKAAGQKLNQDRMAIDQAITARKTALEDAALNERLATETLDLTLSAAPALQGSIHPITKTLFDLQRIFAQMGFDLGHGPDIEDDWHNFSALNFPPLHPARQMHDTFYLPNGVLRTHTSPVQIRYLKDHKPPVRMVSMGRTFRSDSDQTHTPMFHQVEGLVLEPNIHMGHLKGTLEAFLKTFFELDTLKMRFRPSYFPFTEPSVEVDIAYAKQNNQLQIGKGDNWLEVLGAGMVHPNVLKNAGVEDAQGFAFGAGVERLAMLKYGITDLRQFFDNHTDWLNHYGFKAWESAC